MPRTTATRRPVPSRKLDPRREVSACLAALWPLLLAASNAIDRPRPEKAAPHLQAAAARILETVSRLTAGEARKSGTP